MAVCEETLTRLQKMALLFPFLYCPTQRGELEITYFEKKKKKKFKKLVVRLQDEASKEL